VLPPDSACIAFVHDEVALIDFALDRFERPRAPARPAIAAAFGRGEVSCSKVRAITRIARPETEADLLAMARDGSAA